MPERASPWLDPQPDAKARHESTKSASSRGRAQRCANRRRQDCAAFGCFLIPPLREVSPDAALDCASVRECPLSATGPSRHYSGVSPAELEVEEAVEVRAFRGTRKSSVYREHVLAESAFVCILDVAARERLTLLSSLDQYGPHELGKGDARRLADEATGIRAGGVLPELDDDLTAIAEVASWRARATEDSWLRIEGP